MGQYYMVYTKTKEGSEICYNRTVDGEYMMAKLMEHSWWKNPFVNTLCAKMYHSPTTIAWVGDYANESAVYEKVWGENATTIGVDSVEFELAGKVLVNHTRKEYLNLDSYYDRSKFKWDDEDEDFWCIHPLPLLTCIGNGLGGGDYFSQNSAEYVGSWYLNEISIEDAIPFGYEELVVKFVE